MIRIIQMKCRINNDSNGICEYCGDETLPSANGIVLNMRIKNVSIDTIAFCMFCHAALLFYSKQLIGRTFTPESVRTSMKRI